MERQTNFVALDVVLLVAVVAFIVGIFDLSGWIFFVELFIACVCIFAFVIGMLAAHGNLRHGWAVTGATSLLVLANSFFLMFIQPQVSLVVAMIFSLAAIFICFASVGTAQEVVHIVEYDSREYYPSSKKPTQISDGVRKEEIKQELREEMKEEIKEGVKEGLKEELMAEKMKLKQENEEAHFDKLFSPGKYVASRKANKFHAPKCDWAGRIKKENEIWFSSKEDAKQQGFEADECV